MVAHAPALDDAVAKLGAGPRGQAGKGAEPQLWMGRAELLLPLRVNRGGPVARRVLREGQLFTVRRGTVKRGDKHPGRRAPRSCPTSCACTCRLCSWSSRWSCRPRTWGAWTGHGAGLGGGAAGSARGAGGAGGAAAFGLGAAAGAGATGAAGSGSGSGRDGEGGPGPSAASKKMCFFQGMSIVIQEHCLPASPDADASSNAGVLFRPKQRPAPGAPPTSARTWWWRHTDMDQTPLRMFEKLRKSFQRSMSVEEGGRRVDGGAQMVPWLTACFGSVVKRMRIIRCVPGTSDSCTLKIPLGPARTTGDSHCGPGGRRACALPRFSFCSLEPLALLSDCFSYLSKCAGRSMPLVHLSLGKLLKYNNHSHCLESA